MQHNQNPSVVIDWFDEFDGPNPFSFLSNFHELTYPLQYRGLDFPTTEHAFAYMKVDPEARGAYDWQRDIRFADDPGIAKALGRRCPMREDWDVIKFAVMREIVWEKFYQDPELGSALLVTGSAYLQEGTYWNDRIWGVDITVSPDPFSRPGWNMLGAILMETRTRLHAMGVSGLPQYKRVMEV
jgi:ribA/ribD-fused uncharacterized protein